MMHVKPWPCTLHRLTLKTLTEGQDVCDRHECACLLGGVAVMLTSGLASMHAPVWSAHSTEDIWGQLLSCWLPT